MQAKHHTPWCFAKPLCDELLCRSNQISSAPDFGKSHAIPPISSHEFYAFNIFISDHGYEKI
jgi:hypothetical protein